MMELPEGQSQSIRELFEGAVADSAGIDSIMLATRDGHPAVFVANNDVVPGKFAAMSSSITALGKTILRELESGALNHVLVEGENGKVVFVRVSFQNDLFILSLLAESDLLLGRMSSLARSLAKQVDAILTA
jgi:predicted regulator of Ras-like GTPase activity (Roadblock/LC7/MglB family)